MQKAAVRVEGAGALSQFCDGIQFRLEPAFASGAMWSADEIAELCYLHYRTRLPKQGKPDPSREWTSLAAVVKVECATKREVLASPGKVQGKNELWELGGKGERRWQSFCSCFFFFLNIHFKKTSSLCSPISVSIQILYSL